MSSYYLKKVAYLTFDDGPVKNTSRILRLLKHNGVKATFFVNGNETKFGRLMYRRIIQQGHAIGNHTYTHNHHIIYSSKAAFLKDFNRMELALKRIIGKTPMIYRFPYGSDNWILSSPGGRRLRKKIITALSRRGYQFFDWNIDSGDSYPTKPKPLTSKEIMNKVISECTGKSRVIILFHDFSENSIKALPFIIRKLRKRNFVFKCLSKNSFNYQFKL
ncbi:polysaccharide deacetylase family protein [Paenibacillus sp. NPDC058071]|uniref:polysaccharide deacetylase family protein n=1 Tax=Paenibacillus sp. NPDC058071 TaxID=3346326 RepID=UPI0036D9E6A7